MLQPMTTKTTTDTKKRKPTSNQARAKKPRAAAVPVADQVQIEVEAAACKSKVTVSPTMRTCSTATHSFNQMKKALESDGFLCVKGLVPVEAVAAANNKVLAFLRENGFIASDTIDGIAKNLGDKSPNLLQQQRLAFSEPVREATAHPAVVELLAHLLDSTDSPDFPGIRQELGVSESSQKAKPPPPHYLYPSVTQIPYSWLRAVSTGKCTGPHMDRVYLGSGSQRILTVWMPFTDVPISRGSLCIAAQSHNSKQMKEFRQEYGGVPAGRDGTNSGWVTEYPDQIEELYGIGTEGGESKIQWVTRDFQKGDVVIFGLDLLHMTLNNVTDTWRISCETRWQPTGDAYPPFFHTKLTKDMNK